MKENKKIENSGFTRREFMRLSALSSGLLFMGGCGELWERQAVLQVDHWHKGVCRFCGTGCGIQIGVHKNKVVDVKGDKYAHNRGRLCAKGIMNQGILYAEDRALYPMIRKNGKLQRASWDEAMSLMAEKFKEAIDTYGPDSVGYYGSGQLFTEESYTANKLFKAGIRTNNVDGNPRLCMASAAVGYTAVFGIDEPMGSYSDIDHANCILITGSNMADCHPIIWERVMDRKRSNPDTFIIVIDPRKTLTARKADLHLQILPSTDVTLYNSLLYEVIRRGATDMDMVENYLAFRQGEEVRDFEAFKAHLQDYAPEKVASVCGVSTEAIREAAYRFTASASSMSLWTMGINQQVQGVAANHLLNALHLITGQIGRPGATPFSLTGQPNAGGGVRDTGSLAHALPNGRKIASEKDRNEMEKLWGVPEGSINPKVGYNAIAMFQAMERGDLKCALIMCTNPAQSLPNINRYKAAMEKTFLVVADAFHPTETSQLADILLPAAMWVEKGGVFSQSERRYHYIPKIMDAPGEARSDFEILIEFAERLGLGHILPAKTQEAVWEEWRNISAHSNYNFKGITYERLKKERGILWPCPDENHPGTEIRYVPGKDPMTKRAGRFDFYGRPDGKAVVFLHHQGAVPELTSAEFPMMLTTGRILEHWHTNTITGRLEELDRIKADFVEIHPADATRNGFVNGQEVEIRSARGDARFRVRITDNVREGLLFATFHSARHLVNSVTIDAVDATSRQPAFKHCAVAINPVEPKIEKL